MTDPRQAKTIDEASKNPDGTYNGIRALSWLSEVMNPGKGIPEAEVRSMAEQAMKLNQEAINGSATK